MSTRKTRFSAVTWTSIGGGVKPMGVLWYMVALPAMPARVCIFVVASSFYCIYHTGRDPKKHWVIKCRCIIPSKAAEKDELLSFHRPLLAVCDFVRADSANGPAPPRPRTTALPTFCIRSKTLHSGVSRCRQKRTVIVLRQSIHDDG